MILILVFLAGCLYLLHQWLSMRPQNFPPGPMHLPLVGCAFSVPYKHPHLKMESWREKYGPIVGLLLGPRLKAIAVCEPQAVFEVLRREEFQNRPDGKAFRERTLNKRLGILFTDGLYWEKHRHFSIKHLKELGFGKKSMERVILDEVEDLIIDIRDRTMQVADLFSCYMLNVLWSITAGDRFSPKDERLKELLTGVNITFRSSTKIGPFLSRILPFLKKITPQLVGYTQEIEARHKIQNFIREVIKAHTSTLDTENPRDFIDVYLTEVQARQDPDFTEDGLIGLLFDLFGAGAEPISNTLAFALLYLILHPDVQQKLQKQIDTVVGKSSRISLDHRSQLPYLEAVIAEVFRINTIAPLGTPHCAAKDTIINGFSIPKNTFILISFWSVLQDSKHWGDPDVFRPERFIDPDTGNFIKDPWLINFGMGKRICVGETLARSNLFLFLGSILQEFEIISKGALPSTEAQTGFLTAPQPFEILFKSRT